VQSKSLGGLDSLLSIVQMPAGVPVATFAIGAAGATNAALCAAAILANKHPAIATALEAYRERQTAGVLATRSRARRRAHDGRHRGRRPLWAACSLWRGYPLGLDFLCLDPARQAPAGPGRPAAARRLYRSELLTRLRAGAARS